MRPQCIDAVQAVAKNLGRAPLTKAQIAAVDDRIAATMRRLARTEQGWQGLSPDARLQRAAEQAMQEIQAEAARKVANAELQVVKTAAIEQQLADIQRLNPEDKRAHTLVEHIERTGDYIQGIKMDAMAGMIGAIDAAKASDGASYGRRAAMFLFDVENPTMTRDLAAEIFDNGDGHTGNKIAQDGAKAWLQTIENLRQRFNSAGGDVRKLDYGYLPQPHDNVRVRSAGTAEWAKQQLAAGNVNAARKEPPPAFSREHWVEKILPLLDRSRYVDEAGARLGDAEVTAMLRSAWETISTDGLNKQEPGAFHGSGARANRGSESREIHFKDAEAFQAYMREFGAGSMYDAMAGHVGRMARDIGLVERYGPNPNAQMRLQFDLAAKADGTGVDNLPRSFGLRPQSYWDHVSGVANTPASARLAQLGTDARNIQTFGKLAGAVISSVTDLGTFFVTTGFNKLSYWDSIANIRRTATSKDARQFLTTHGIIADSMMGDLSRWTSDNIKQNWSGRLANSTMKLSLMNAWTDTLRRAFSLTMMQGLARLSKTEWGKLSEWDRTHMERKGLTEADWKVISQADLTAFQGMDHLTPESIRAVDVLAVRPEDAQRIKDAIAAQTAELTARNTQEQAWIKGRIDKFDDARDALNREVKLRAAKRGQETEAATGPLLERMSLLEAQRESAQLQADMETDFNRFVTQDEARAFLNAVEDGASADKTDIAKAKPALRRGLEAAESVGRRYGIQKGRLERRMVELQNKIGEMDRAAGRETNADAKAAQAKADEMLEELRAFTKRSQERQARRVAVIDRLQGAESARLADEADRIKNEVVSKVLGLIQDESEFAVMNPDLATKVIATGGSTQRGTVRGELARSVMQFKSFPIAMVSRHWRRMLDMPAVTDGSAPGFQSVPANRALYIGALMVSTTALGAIALQGKQVAQGKDPIDMTGKHAGKFWARAVAQGGGLSIVGDALLNDPGTDPMGFFKNSSKTILGPSVGTGIDAGALVVGNTWDKIMGRKTHVGAETANLIRGNAPYVNLWYAKAAIDHAGMHALQENLSPGYLAKMKQKAKKDWGQDYWWAPGTGGPERAPDIGEAVGQ